MYFDGLTIICGTNPSFVLGRNLSVWLHGAEVKLNYYRKTVILSLKRKEKCKIRQDIDVRYLWRSSLT